MFFDDLFKVVISVIKPYLRYVKVLQGIKKVIPGLRTHFETFPGEWSIQKLSNENYSKRQKKMNLIEFRIIFVRQCLYRPFIRKCLKMCFGTRNYLFDAPQHFCIPQVWFYDASRRDISSVIGFISLKITSDAQKHPNKSLYKPHE